MPLRRLPVVTFVALIPALRPVQSAPQIFDMFYKMRAPAGYRSGCSVVAPAMKKVHPTCLVSVVTKPIVSEPRSILWEWSETEVLPLEVGCCRPQI